MVIVPAVLFRNPAYATALLFSPRCSLFLAHHDRTIIATCVEIPSVLLWSAFCHEKQSVAWDEWMVGFFIVLGKKNVHVELQSV